MGDKYLTDQINVSLTQALQTKGKLQTCLTKVLDGEVALLVVHFDGLSVGTADAIADGVTAHHDVLVLWRRPAHHDAVDQRPHMQRAGLVRYS